MMLAASALVSGLALAAVLPVADSRSERAFRIAAGAALGLGVSGALSMALLVSAGLFTSSLVQVSRIDLGLKGVDATTDFDAHVKNDLPQIVSGGVAWKVIPRLELNPLTGSPE